MPLKFENATKIYPNGYKALDNVSIEIEDKQIVGLLGPNGSGKTTCAGILAGLHTMQFGKIIFDNQIIDKKNIAYYRQNIGYCPQNSTLNDDITIKENLLQSASYFGMSKTEANNALGKTIDLFKLEKYLKHYPTELSGGWVKRVMIARALIHNPLFIILDEPTIALDPAIRNIIWEMIINLRNQNKKILLITHYLEEANKLCDRIYILDQGKIIADSKNGNLNQQHELEEIFEKLSKEDLSPENEYKEDK